jgi:hypothetical protein
MIKRFMVCMLMLSFVLMGCSIVETENTPEMTKISTIETSDLTGQLIDWYGRIAYLNQKTYFFHTATGFKVAFYGRVVDFELSLEMKRNDIYYSVGKDGEDLLDAEVFVQRLSTEVLRVEFEDFGHHVVEVVKRSEPEDGVTSLVKVTTNGYFVENEDEDQPHFLMIGASGISGHGALGNPGQPRTTENSSSLHAFGYLTARAFDGSFEFVANSGWGLAFGYNDLTGTDNIARAYEYIGIDQNQNIIEIPYDHGKVPDYIIINIGGNDYTAVINKLSGFAKTEKILEFKKAVADFIMKLRMDAPDAHIFWTMTEGSMNGTAASEVIQQLGELDRNFVHVVVIKQVASDGDLAGANNHASFITHQKSAQIVIELIENIQNTSN